MVSRPAANILRNRGERSTIAHARLGMRGEGNKLELMRNKPSYTVRGGSLELVFLIKFLSK